MKRDTCELSVINLANRLTGVYGVFFVSRTYLKLEKFLLLRLSK